MALISFVVTLPLALIGLTLLAFAVWRSSAEKGLRIGLGIVGGVLAVPSIVMLAAFVIIMLTARAGP